MAASLLPDGEEIIKGLGECSRTLGPWPWSFSPWRRGGRLPKFSRWHVTTQERLFEHLRVIWADDRPRVMVDLGCHAGHGLNMSDALLWLHHWNATGSLVVGVDIVEDYALDLQYRFNDVEPYRSMANVEKRALHRALTGRRGSRRTMPAVFALSCKPGWSRIERMLNISDHYCRITRQRLGISPSRLPLPRSNYPQWWADVLRTMDSSANSSRPAPRIKTPAVQAGRADEIWREAPLHSRHIDFLKVDVDRPWRQVGIDDLISRRAISAMVIEVDNTWSWERSHYFHPGARIAMLSAGMENVSKVDLLVFFGRRHGYASYLKVPCCARPSDGLESASPQRSDRKFSAYYLPLSSPAEPYEPSGIDVRRMGFIQDLLLVDASDPKAQATLERLGRASCYEEFCCGKHSKRTCATLESSRGRHGAV